MIVEDHNDNELPREPDLSSLEYHGGTGPQNRSPAQYGRRSQPGSGNATPQSRRGSETPPRQKRPMPIEEGRSSMPSGMASPPDLKRVNPNQRRFRDAFRSLQGEDGKVSTGELTEHLVKKGIITGGMANSGDLAPLFQACDRRGDGRVSYQDVEAMMRGPGGLMGGTPRQQVCVCVCAWSTVGLFV